MYNYETSKEFLIMSLNKINVAVFYPLPSLETPCIIVCRKGGLKEPGAMKSGSDITTLST